MSAEGVNAARAAAGKQLTLQEAEMILGVEAGASWQDVLKVRRPAACLRIAALAVLSHVLHKLRCCTIPCIWQG